MDTNGQGPTKRLKLENFTATTTAPPTTSINGAILVDSIGDPTNTSTIAVSSTNVDITATNLTLNNTTLATIDDIHSGTGILTGGEITIAGDPTEFDVTAGTGEIQDVVTQVVTPISWNAFTGASTAYVGVITFVSIVDSGGGVGALDYSSTKPTNTQLRSKILLGVLVHPDQVTIVAVNNEQMILTATNNQIRDFMEAIGFVNVTHNIVSYTGTADLSLSKSAGTILKFGGNYATNKADPHIISLTAIDTSLAGSGFETTFQYRLFNGNSGPINQKLLTANAFDDLGVGTFPLGTTLANNRWGVDYVFVFTSGAMKIQPTQYAYFTVEAARASIGNDVFSIESSIAANGLLIGYILHRGDVTDMTDSLEAQFIQAGKFGSSVNSVVGGNQSLQSAYDNDIAPIDITTDNTRYALTVKNGIVADETQLVFEGLNNSETTTFSVAGNGNLYCAGNITVDGTVDGIDIATDVAANTAKVSADGSIDTHSDVTLTAVGDGEVLQYSSGAFINQTLAEAGIAPTTYNLQNAYNQQPTPLNHVNMGSDGIQFTALVGGDFVVDSNSVNSNFEVRDGGTAVITMTGAGAVNIAPTNAQNLTATVAGVGEIQNTISATGSFKVSDAGDQLTIAGGSSVVAVTNALTVGTTAVITGSINADNFETDINSLGNITIGTTSANYSGAADNICIGERAGDSITSAAQNTFIGTDAGTDDTTGNANVCVGFQAGMDLDSAVNTTVGYLSGRYISSGAANTGVGAETLGGQSSANALTGNDNTAVGKGCLRKIRNVSNQNTALGSGAGITITTGARNVLLGYLAGDDLILEDDQLRIEVDSNLLISGNFASSNVALGGVGDFNSGTQCLFISESATAPTTAAVTGGGLLYVDAGALKYMGTAGNVTQLAAS